MLVLLPLGLVVLSRSRDRLGGFECAFLLRLSEDKGHLLKL